MNKKIKSKGFTLIELIVVITIIAVLTVVAMVSYTGAGKRARDGRRVSDLEKIRIALEMYRQNVGSSYPATLSTLVPNYIQVLPNDPKGVGVSYVYSHTGYTYTVRATVEDPGSSNVAGGIYQVTNP